MHIFLGVENFAKIESAKVCINSYTLLVGPNNSGKTYFMQLAQGVNERLANLVEEDALQILLHKENAQAGYIKYTISQQNILQFVSYLNKKLEEKKEQIIREIFGKEIPVGKLYIDIFLNQKESYGIYRFKNINAAVKMKDSLDAFTKRIVEKVALLEGSQIGVLTQYDPVREKDSIRLVHARFEMDEGLINSVLENILGYQSLFLPASRTGIMLLYREFFANKADSIISYQMMEEQLIENKNNYGEFTQPVYQFLRFLQLYSEREERKNYYKNEIDFFEKKLIEGHISTNNSHGLLYDSEADHISVPMYMASSMINEIAPFVLALADSKGYNRLIIDEIEASLHPKKQLELVRFLNRLSNKGIKLILSTHSDTFASKVNNLFILSTYIRQNKGCDLVKKLGLEKEDLMDPDKLYVYEFVNQSNGHSIVKEIAGDGSTGFQFDLFTDSAMHLYNEALEIGELLQNDKS